ncbi:hypothetical protein [Corallococcus carmarthensis]|uniref:Lipoprotein n=1 Tax=Corallococcus carmarthensis TaxID=2316728 RepID=A0A3A8JEB1_9BACT|nr:hypothetical protein [Corallococcus carmarthensis]NOK23322.1 hypothetical protein [Corallococcus carmarthensis]RKG94117.1 hypothetical protein D7X32_43020 [Corallococcus carmarthensis]
MKNILFGLAAMASLTLTACGGNVCDDSADAFNSLVDKVSECGLPTTGFEAPTDAEIESCKDSLDSCTDADKDKLSEYADCVSDVKGCSDKTASEQQAFALRLTACSSKLDGVSDACSAQ